MKKTKILHILHAVGGVDVSLRLIVSNIDSNRFENVIIHGTDDTKEKYIDRNGDAVKAYQLPIFRNISIKNDWKSLKEIKKIIDLEKPNLIHGHSAKGGILSKLAGHSKNIPVLHTPQAYSFLSAENSLKKLIYLQIEKFISKYENKILASSSSERNRAVNEVGYPESRALLFNNSIKPITQVENLSIPKTWPDYYICSVGRPSYQKNIEMMVEVMQLLKQEKPDIHLVLMGVGYHSPNLETVKEKINEYQLQENITLLEWTKREDIFNIIKNAQLYISTARYEGLPYSIIESMALSKACVITDADGNRDLVKNEENGYVIFGENIQDFKNKTLQVLNDNNKREAFERNSYKKFNQYFNIENTISNLEEIYITNRN